MSEDESQQARVEFRGAQIYESAEQVDVVEVEEMTEEGTA